MTEAGWLSSEDALAMLEWRRFGRPDGIPAQIEPVSDRKLRLFAVACWRQWDTRQTPKAQASVARPPFLDALARAELIADGQADPNDDSQHPFCRSDAGAAARSAIEDAAADVAGARPLDAVTQAALLREVVGDPFRPVARPTVSPDAGAIARAIYEDRDWALMGVLADALEEEGCVGELCDCTNDWCPPGYRKPHPLLAHLRSAGPHVRGCWAVDLVLGKD